MLAIAKCVNLKMINLLMSAFYVNETSHISSLYKKSGKVAPRIKHSWPHLFSASSSVAEPLTFFLSISLGGWGVRRGLATLTSTTCPNYVIADMKLWQILILAT